MSDIHDLLIVGGGINGAGIARDAAGRGLKVALCEQGDLAGATSSASGKLIHGGLRYLEHYDFRLVREALSEREVLMRIAPHITRPLRFVIPHVPSLRPYPLVRLGLFLYDHLGVARTLPGCEAIGFARDPRGAPLAAQHARGFVYSDVWVDDARLVLLNCADAASRGATILTRTRCVGLQARRDHWTATLEDAASGARSTLTARVVVNAAGPWVQHVIEHAARRRSPYRVRLVKGSHLVLRKFYDGDQAYVFQNDDRRLIFVVPFEDDHLIVGTTDIAFEGDPGAAAMDEAEIAYLLDVLARNFRHRPGAGEIAWRYSGVRPLYDDGAANPSAVTRDYVLALDHDAGTAPLLSVFGGKITTYRRLAEHAMRKLAMFFPGLAPAWTGTRALPGGETRIDGKALRARYPFLAEAVASRLARSYGACAPELLGDASSAASLGAELGGGLTERELEWLVRREWAQSVDDVIWRRTKLGLVLDEGARERIASALARLASPRGFAAPGR